MPTTTVDASTRKLGEVSQKMMDEKAWMMSKNFDSDVIRYMEETFERVNLARVIWPDEEAIGMINVSIKMLSDLGNYLDDGYARRNNNKEVKRHIAELYRSASDLADTIGADAAAENLAWIADTILESL